VADPFAQARATALALLRKKGKSVMVSRRSGVPDKVTGKRASAAKGSAQFTCLGLPAGPTAERYVGTLVGKRTLEFYLAPLPGTAFPIEPGDLVPWGGRTYSLVWVSDLDPGDTGSLFTRAYGQV
jgi:hypothetical protein